MKTGTRISVGLIVTLLCRANADLPRLDAKEPTHGGTSCYEAEFTSGDQTPTGWQLSGGQGRWVDRKSVEVTGTGNDSNYWRSDGCQFGPGRLYRFEMQARRTGGSGCVICGPSFANRDHSGISNDWKWYSHVFRAPDRTDGAFLRLGQWMAQGTVQFGAVRVCPTLPVPTTADGLTLGDGEAIRDGVYRFLGTFGHEGSNYHRTLVSATAGFNSDRWCFGAGNQVTYRFAVAGHKFLSGRIGFHVNYYTRGVCVAELSRDQQNWHEIATQQGLGNPDLVLPKKLLPAGVLYLRLRAGDKGSSFQVNRIDFESQLSGTPPNVAGSTSFADLQNVCSDLVFQSLALEESSISGGVRVRVLAKNTSCNPATVTLAARVTAPDQSVSDLPAKQQEVGDGKEAEFSVDLEAQQPGKHCVELTLASRTGCSTQTSLSIVTPEYYRADYGELLSVSRDDVPVWWCDATRKVPRQRPAPTTTGAGAHIWAAKNDFEAVQIVVRPSKPLKGFAATARVAAGGKGISEDDIQVLRVHYHFVDQPTDRTGVRDYWPDALPPLSSPIDLSAGNNQPLWVLVRVPKDADTGDYDIELALRADGWSATVPIRLHVWDFALPERNHVETAFGLSVGNIFRYHQIKRDEDKRRVLDLYFQSFADHRISPYNPAPFDPIRVQFLPKETPPRAQVDFSAFDPAMTRAVDRFHFTGFRLPIVGMGGGTFHSRSEPQIHGFGEGTPEYQTMFSSYAKQLESHLQAKGWLDLAYVYWFDEPAPKDYEFVTNGMNRLKKYAPGLRRMLTEEPNDQLAAPIDIWCPVTSNYDHSKTEAPRKSGAEFWWYVCTGPKAPYCTLFIDHPATELRVWLWQTWQRDVSGILVWQSNYWTSDAAFPDVPQNPYNDPMGYVSGYSTPRGVKRFWGNGDGRFIYPPLSAATSGVSGSSPVLDPPVSSIRWEMLREGIEDYEFLYILRQLLDDRRVSMPADQIQQYETLLDVPKSITEDMTTFATDSSPIYARRAAIAHAIEQLTRLRQ